MTIRPFQPGDETAQAAIFNAAAAGLPGFKPATPEDVRRRVQLPGFDPTTRFYIEEEGRIVAYAAYNANGRISYPWCLPGFEFHAEPLMLAVLDGVRAHGNRRAFAAYPEGWTAQAEFFAKHGFALAREMVNFVLGLKELPTLTPRPGNTITELRRDDVPDLFALAPGLWRVSTAVELNECLFDNPQLSADTYFAMRRPDGSIAAAGTMIENAAYSSAEAADPLQPCFRLGAFGTEGMQHKRVNGLFSFVAPTGRDVTSVALDLLSYAALKLRGDSVKSFAAQVPSDAPHLLHFYQHLFRRQGSFPMYEREL